MLINQNNYCIGDIIIYVGFTRIKIGKINELSPFYYPTGEVLMGVPLDHPYKGKEYTPVDTHSRCDMLINQYKLYSVGDIILVSRTGYTIAFLEITIIIKNALLLGREQSTGQEWWIRLDYSNIITFYIKKGLPKC